MDMNMDFGCSILDMKCKKRKERNLSVLFNYSIMASLNYVCVIVLLKQQQLGAGVLEPIGII